MPIHLGAGGCRLSCGSMLLLSLGCSSALMTEANSPAGASAARCSLGASQTSVLVTEWRATEKSNLEELATHGAIAVEFTGCELKLISECKLPGSYVWRRTTPSSDVVDIRDEAELYAKLPLGAATLATELQRSGRLQIQTTVSGQLRLADMTPSQVTAAPECARATHIVDGVALGAFVLNAGGAMHAGGGLGFKGAAVGGERRHEESIVRTAGEASSCSASTDVAAAPSCASPIQVFLLPIPGRTEPAGPPGTVRIEFVSEKPSARWDVIIDDQASCTTPCAQWVDPEHPLELRTRDSGAPGLGVDEVSLRRLETGAAPARVTAKPTSTGQFITGLTFLSLGGMAAVTGVALTSVGCSSSDRRSMCKAGLISGGTGLAVSGGALWMMLDALPEVHVQPLFGADSISVGPARVSGTF